MERNNLKDSNVRNILVALTNPGRFPRRAREALKDSTSPSWRGIATTAGTPSRERPEQQGACGIEAGGGDKGEGGGKELVVNNVVNSVVKVHADKQGRSVKRKRLDSSVVVEGEA